MLEIPFRHMSFRLREQKERAGFHRTMDLGKKTASIGNFVNHGKRQTEIDLAVILPDVKGLLRRFDRHDAIEHASFLGALPEFLQHLLLDVHADHFSVRPDPPCERKREIAHSRTDLEYRHALAHVRTKNLLRRVAEFPERDEQKVSHPPGTDVRCAFLLHG